jgi:1-acyl-sn-glycerol-3-phosphate acyltransferase
VLRKLRSVKSAIFGAYTYLEFAACMVGVLPFAAASRLRHRKDPVPRMAGRWVRRLGTTSSALTPLWKFSVEGEAPADIDHKSYIVVANHESQADPFLLSHLPWDMRWVAKEELFRPPVSGWLMRLGGDIPLRRGKRDSIKEMFDACKYTLANGLSVMIFPEGTRSRDGALLPFKSGAFQLAMETGRPILPIALAGTRRCRPKGSLWFGEAKAIAKVLKPLDPADFQGSKGMERLRDAARASIVTGVHDLENRLGFTPVPPKPQSEVREDREAPVVAAAAAE